MSITALKALAQLIISNVETIESTCQSKGTEFPSLDDLFEPSVLDAHPAILGASRQIVAAAAQIIATVRPPMELLSEHATGMYSTAALAFINSNDVVDVIQLNGTRGMHSKEIGQKIGVDGSKVDRVLRYLATRHIFREVRPNVFVNNKVSSLLLKSKPWDELVADPSSKYAGALGASAIGHTTEEGFMGAPYIPQFLKNPGQYQSPFNMSIKDTTNIFAWYEQAENLWRGRRFVVGMRGAGERFPPEIFTSAIDWKGLPQGSTVVDVGANVGTVTLPLAKAFPHLHFILQDLDHAISDAKVFWQDRFPEALSERRVEFQVHDFFTPMPVKADVYFLRLILHDWPQEEGIKILKHIRAAAKPTSILIIFEMIVLHACPETSKFAAQSPVPPAPPPLLANYGLGFGGFVTMADMQMLNLLGGRERTIEEFEELGRESGWKLETVKPGPISAFIYTPE
ncbi:hypothetical protein HGRIS_006925 [Hohenbuehelia grisea]|uniref:O-methyltransferase n=1 Tax=Hohenbuehelia grisea TaxID=104357 RepID=A0ABR3JAW8_9AGAR